MTVETLTRPALIARIAERAHAQMTYMIHLANHGRKKQPGDPKVGGHPASCASSAHILAALHLSARRIDDYICCKPHASPMDHAFHHLLGIFRREDDRTWLTEDESKQVMTRLRDFPADGRDQVFQSYHARTDPDSFHMLPTGSVGIPPVVSVYMALAHRYARDHGHEVPPEAHFWSLIGDSEFREGSLLEAMPDAAERQLGNVTWIIDYNRQNLDGTRIPNESGLDSRDCDRIAKTALANGWRVIQARHGRFREELFARPGGAAFRSLFEEKLSDYHYQLLLFKRDAAMTREHLNQQAPDAAALIESLSDDELHRAMGDVGGHDMALMIDTLEEARSDPDRPYLVIAHTIKGWGLECFANPANHSTLPKQKEVEDVLARNGLNTDDAFARFDPESPEGSFLDARGAEFRAGMQEHWALREKNRGAARAAMEAEGGLSNSFDIDMSLFPTTHTQWMWGQVAAKLIRIGTSRREWEAVGEEKADLTEAERRWKPGAKWVLTMSPDVGTSTQIASNMDGRVYGPEFDDDDEHGEFMARHPELAAHPSAVTRHIRFEIAEANCMSAVGAFGKMGHYTGLPFFPIMTVYDFFIKRALDQLYYNLYWGSEFVLIGTPSGVTLSSEGAQHSWKSDIQIPNMVTWEPAYAIEMDWILADAVKRHMEDRNEGRRGVLIRAVTRGIPQKQLLDNLRVQARFKLGASGSLKPKGAGDEWGSAIDESSLECQPDEQILETVREECLAGAYALIHWEGYAGYEPGDNVVNLFSMGSIVTEAVDAAATLLEMGIYANVYSISSPELLLGILGQNDDYRHLRDGLGINGNLHAVEGAGATEAGLISIAGRRIPCVAVCDGEGGLLDNIGSIVGVKQRTLSVTRFSKCGRPDQVFDYHEIDASSIVEACGAALADTALEDLSVAPSLLERLAGRAPSHARPDWRELWPN